MEIQRLTGKPEGCTQPIQYENKTSRNRAIDNPTRTARARAIFEPRPSPSRDFFSMNTPALAKAAMMPTRAKAISSFMSSLSHPVKGGAATGLILLLATALTAGITASLGFWQLDRARQKDAIAASIEAKAVMPPLDTAALGGPEHIHRLAQVVGRWRPDTLVYLENRPMNGQAGFVVLTALELPDGRLVLVQRGWQPRNLRDRTLVQPVPTPPTHAVRVHARVAPPPSRLLDFEGGSQGQVRQNIELKTYAEEFGLKGLLPISLQQLEPALGCTDLPCSELLQDGLRRDWTVVGSSADKNRGYAVQWFALAALALGLYVWFQWWRPWRMRHRTASTAPPADAHSP